MSPLNVIRALVETDQDADTINRLFSSKHVKDLRLIVNVTLWSFLLIIPVGFVVSYEYERVSHWELIEKYKGHPWVNIHLGLAAGANLLAWLAPGLAVVGAVLAWAYQAGSARLGVVDLFSCEISTLCRIATVLESVRHSTDKFTSGPAGKASSAEVQGAATRFTSQEEYFPVFENNTAALEALEARVVANITAFYTYLKAVRDSMRAMAEIPPDPPEVSLSDRISPPIGPWHEAARNVIYVLFLGLESARKAVHDLVEYEPEQAEQTIVILISELEAYRFLREQFTDSKDSRYQRIKLRIPEYEELVPKVRAQVEQARAQEMSDEKQRIEQTHARMISLWEPASLLLDELQKCFDAAIRNPRVTSNSIRAVDHGMRAHVEPSNRQASS